MSKLKQLAGEILGDARLFEEGRDAERSSRGRRRDGPQPKTLPEREQRRGPAAGEGNADQD